MNWVKETRYWLPLENILSHSKKFHGDKNSNQASLFGAAEIALPEIHLSESPIRNAKSNSCAWEKELLGLIHQRSSDPGIYQEYLKKVADSDKRNRAADCRQNDYPSAA